MDKTTINKADMGTAFRIDSHSRMTMLCALILKAGETALCSFRNKPVV
ncbi:hypothetical protein [Atopobium sp. oral taxon 416]|nr:hypothetical protein [Atopobium sp. oral taxon 416]QUC04451.1 hypothetical protein J4859_05840 [Atopobium sp. oral taxon 416]